MDPDLVPVLVVLVVAPLLVLLVWAASSRQKEDLLVVERLLASGVPARGLVLQIGRIAWDESFKKGTYERRHGVVDVEIAGRAPYVIDGDLVIPKQLAGRVLPGTFVDVRIDPKRGNRLLVVGPGGVSFAG